MALRNQVEQVPVSWLTLAMLLPLHMAICWVSAPPSRFALLLIHVGLFVLWQPILERQRRIPLGQAGIVLLAWLTVTYLALWWSLMAWLSVLIGVVASHEVKRHGVLLHLGLVVYLLLALFLIALPQAIQVPLPVWLQLTFSWASPPVLMVAAWLGQDDRRHGQRALDLIYGVLITLLTLLIAMSTVVWSLQAGIAYLEALGYTLLVAAGGTYVLSRIWSESLSRYRFGVLFSRYMISLGTPFEDWVGKVALLYRDATDLPHFAQTAINEVAKLPWMIGGEWQWDGLSGQFGQHSRHALAIHNAGLDLTFYTRHSAAPALVLHCKLITLILAEYGLAKQREQAMRTHALNQAIAETGARLTHDVKNLLQILQGLCAAIDTATPDDAEALQRLIQRQLPAISLRLESTLVKLRSPAAMDSPLSPANDWWMALQTRYANQPIQFEGKRLRDQDVVPGEMMDSILDNLLRNALEKQQWQQGITITVTLAWLNGVTVTVVDNGSAVPAEIAKQLLHNPVQSTSGGMGVGLWQASQLASQYQFGLSLTQNRPGQVCFTLQQQIV
ncbi:ATP-binding protein [Chitinivorax sp. B]|uniref:ATP-binding protein n=1 Tax=Chitinivorax sp. B TaxID=2502235 RepID=UPI0010F7CF22|nr:ATP-binding protein [Chitinivorax sp. B]